MQIKPEDCVHGIVLSSQDGAEHCLVNDASVQHYPGFKVGDEITAHGVSQFGALGLYEKGTPPAQTLRASGTTVTFTYGDPALKTCQLDGGNPNTEFPVELTMDRQLTSTGVLAQFNDRAAAGQIGCDFAPVTAPPVTTVLVPTTVPPATTIPVTTTAPPQLADFCRPQGDGTYQLVYQTAWQPGDDVVGSALCQPAQMIEQHVAVPPKQPTTLPATGAETLLLIGLGSGLIAGGKGLKRLARRFG